MRNPAAAALRDGKFRRRVVKSKRVYSRKGKLKERAIGQVAGAVC